MAKRHKNPNLRIGSQRENIKEILTKEYREACKAYNFAHKFIDSRTKKPFGSNDHAIRRTYTEQWLNSISRVYTLILGLPPPIE